MKSVVFVLVGTLAIGYLGWWSVLVIAGMIVLDLVWVVARALYAGMKVVIDYHGGWRGAWRYVRS